MKILFFHIPSLSMYNQLEPLIVELHRRGHEVIHYNEHSFLEHLKNAPFRFVSYSKYQGYFSTACASDMGLFDLGSLLLITAECMIEFVESEVAHEAPDLILHSKFVAAAKLVANKRRIPAVCLTSGFVFHPRTIVEEERKRTSSVDLENVRSLLRFKKRARDLYGKYLTGTCDFDDIFVNDEELNLIFGFREFQPPLLEVSEHWKFLGPATVNIETYAKSYEVIYVSLGSVFVDNKPFFQLCIDTLGALGKIAIVSLGGRLSPDDFHHVPCNVKLFRFVEQKDVLQKAAVFITQGGDTSIAEAVHCETPMVVVPQIPEQLFNGQQIERLSLGTCIRPSELTSARLTADLLKVIEDPVFKANVQRYKRQLPVVPSAIMASDLIEDFANNSQRSPRAV